MTTVVQPPGAMTSVAPTAPTPTRAATGRVAGPTLPDTSAGVVHVLADGDSPDRVAAATELAGVVAGDTALQVLASPDGPRHDPYRLADRLSRTDADAVVLVAPRRRGPRRLAPGPIVAGTPVAIVQADRPSDLPHTLAPPIADAPWVIAAMAKNVFLDATDHWAATLASGGRDVIDLRADRARRDDLVAGLDAGPRVVLYAGHGRARGWAGYQALRLHHLVPDARAVHGSPSRAVGLVMAFACGTLGRERGRWPFGAGLVDAGLVRSYLGPASSVRTAEARALADIVIDLLAATRPATVADLVTAIDRATIGAPPARRAWRTFRLVGRPDTPVG